MSPEIERPNAVPIHQSIFHFIPRIAAQGRSVQKQDWWCIHRTVHRCGKPYAIIRQRQVRHGCHVLGWIPAIGSGICLNRKGRCNRRHEHREARVLFGGAGSSARQYLRSPRAGTEAIRAVDQGSVHMLCELAQCACLRGGWADRRRVSRPVAFGRIKDLKSDLPRGH